MYNEYVRFRTQENWKFWIVSSVITQKTIKFINFPSKNLQLGLIFKPLFESFNSTVSVASMEELSRTAILWVDQHCSLIEMRPGKCFRTFIRKPDIFMTNCKTFAAVSNQLRYLSTTTDILSTPPSSLQDEVMKAIS